MKVIRLAPNCTLNVLRHFLCFGTFVYIIIIGQSGTEPFVCPNDVTI